VDEKATHYFAKSYEGKKPNKPRGMGYTLNLQKVVKEKLN
jgi:hypothetical protein